jgi:hypothetical protein
VHAIAGFQHTGLSPLNKDAVDKSKLNITETFLKPTSALTQPLSTPASTLTSTQTNSSPASTFTQINYTSVSTTQISQIRASTTPQLSSTPASNSTPAHSLSQAQLLTSIGSGLEIAMNTYFQQQKQPCE